VRKPSSGTVIICIKALVITDTRPASSLSLTPATAIEPEGTRKRHRRGEDNDPIRLGLKITEY
jgi:hypothetical protein